MKGDERISDDHQNQLLWNYFQGLKLKWSHHVQSHPKSTLIKSLQRPSTSYDFKYPWAASCLSSVQIMSLHKIKMRNVISWSRENFHPWNTFEIYQARSLYKAILTVFKLHFIDECHFIRSEQQNEDEKYENNEIWKTRGIVQLICSRCCETNTIWCWLVVRINGDLNRLKLLMTFDCRLKMIYGLRRRWLMVDNMLYTKQ